ncbi:MAG: hypothetical protein O3B84_00530 [Chloroflexi bacterium]|nr:hypothetical protein [Chloroflexota bacterium]
MVTKDNTLEIVETVAEASVCACGKAMSDCQCANGEECTCGGDPRLCGVQVVSSLDVLETPAKG